MIALCRGVLYQWLWGMSIGCYISDLYLANINNWIHSLLQKEKKEKKKKNLRILKLRLKEYIHVILEVHVLWTNINIGK